MAEAAAGAFDANESSTKLTVWPSNWSRQSHGAPRIPSEVRPMPACGWQARSESVKVTQNAS